MTEAKYPKRIYVLELELEGDYDDFYQRPTEVVTYSESEAELKAFWMSLEEKVRARDSQVFRLFEEQEYIDCNIYAVTHLKEELNWQKQSLRETAVS